SRGFRKPARYRELGGLGHAVMNHLHGNLEGRLARDEDNTPPVLLHHGTDIMAAQPDSAQYVHLEQAAPIVVGDLFKRLRLEDAKIVHQDVDGGETRNDSARPGFGAQVRRDSMSGAAGPHRFVDPLLSAAIYDDRRALLRQRGSDGQANAGSGSSH